MSHDAGLTVSDTRAPALSASIGKDSNFVLIYAILSSKRKRAVYFYRTTARTLCHYGARRSPEMNKYTYKILIKEF